MGDIRATNPLNYILLTFFALAQAELMLVILGSTVPSRT
jgi:hypothetical protein